MVDMATYQKHRSSVENGDILAFHGKSFFSKAIQWVSSSPYSHVSMLLWVKAYKTPRLMMVHAAYPEGVVLVHASRYLNQYKGEADLVRADHEMLRSDIPNYRGFLADWMMEQSGRRYDKIGVLRHVLPILKNKASEYYCSELVAGAYIALGAMGKDQAEARPDEIVDHPLFVDKIALS